MSFIILWREFLSRIHSKGNPITMLRESLLSYAVAAQYPPLYVIRVRAPPHPFSMSVHGAA